MTGNVFAWSDSGAATDLARSAPMLHHTVVFQIRLPRIIAAALVGGGLSLAGCSLQGLFKNPLVSPDILGVASGAGFGAALGILLSGHPLVVQVSAFSFGLVAVAVTYGIGRMYRSGAILILVLSGIMVSALFSALLSLVKYVADPYDTLPAIVFWLMGSLASVTGQDLVMVAPPILIASLILVVLRWRINLMALGDDEARSLGIDTKKDDQDHCYLCHRHHGFRGLHQWYRRLGGPGGAPHRPAAGGTGFQKTGAGFRADRGLLYDGGGQCFQDGLFH